MNGSKPIIGIVLIGIGAVLIYMGWKGLHVAIGYLGKIGSHLGGG